MGGKKDVLIFSRANHVYSWSLSINFNIYAKMMKVEYLRREYLPDTIVTWNAANFVLAALPRKHYEQRDGGMNVCSILGEWQAQQWVQRQGEGSGKNRVYPDYRLRGVLLRICSYKGNHWNGHVYGREDIYYLVRLLWETWESGLKRGELCHQEPVMSGKGCCSGVSETSPPMKDNLWFLLLFHLFAF